MAVTDTRANSNYDIVIVGGGMVGISLALLLRAQRPWKILVVEAQELAVSDSPVSGAYSSSFDARSTALSWSSRNIYQSIAVWPQLKRHLAAIAQIHVSDRGHAGLTRIDAADANVDALGYVVENQWLGSVLLNQLAVNGRKIRISTPAENLAREPCRAKPTARPAAPTMATKEAV